MSGDGAYVGVPLSAFWTGELFLYVHLCCSTVLYKGTLGVEWDIAVSAKYSLGRLVHQIGMGRM
jgi:hypothetical protein